MIFYRMKVPVNAMIAFHLCLVTVREALIQAYVTFIKNREVNQLTTNIFHQMCHFCSH